MEGYCTIRKPFRQRNIQKKFTIFATCAKMVFVFYAIKTTWFFHQIHMECVKISVDENIKLGYTRFQSEYKG